MVTEPVGPLTLAVMAKAPIAGVAKTRLAASLGNELAATLYRGFLLDTLAVHERTARERAGSRRLAVCPNDEHARILQTLTADNWPILVQRRRGLMGGILDGFEAGFVGGANAVVVTDADSPYTLLEHLPACLESLIEHDLLLGPTTDGGYYLIAARRSALPFLEDILIGVEYDGSTICRDTVARARALNLKVGLGPMGFDVDTQDELRSLASRLAERPGDDLIWTRSALAEHSIA